MLKKHRAALTVFMIFCFSITLLGNESIKIYFPDTIDSFWVYEDQNGNELTRTAVEGEEIAGEIFPAFSYEPKLENWVDYNWFIHPFLYHVSEEGITLVVGEDVGNAVEARLKNELNMFANILEENILAEQGPPETEIPDFELDIDVEAKGQEQLLLLPENVVVNEEWDVNQIEVNVKIAFLEEGVSQQQLAIDYTIIETGIILGTETVETIAGTFEDCLKVEYRTETTATLTPEPPPEEVNPPGETFTTVWFAPNVGIVKLHQKSGHLFLDMVPDDAFPIVIPENEEKTYELINHEIKTTESENGTEN